MNKKPKEVIQSQKVRSAKAMVKFLRIGPRKIRGVIDTIRFKHPDTAFAILASINKKGARMVEKILKTAVANAKVLGMDESLLVISDVRADGGPVMKRFMERSMGRANRILKRTTHLSMHLTEKAKLSSGSSVPQAKAETQEAPAKISKKVKASAGKKQAAAAK